MYKVLPCSYVQHDKACNIEGMPEMTWEIKDVYWWSGVGFIILDNDMHTTSNFMESSS